MTASSCSKRSSDGVLQSRTEHIYDEAGTRTESRHFEAPRRRAGDEEDRDLEIAYVTSYTYDDAGRLVAERRRELPVLRSYRYECYGDDSGVE